MVFLKQCYDVIIFNVFKFISNMTFEDMSNLCIPLFYWFPSISLHFQEENTEWILKILDANNIPSHDMQYYPVAFLNVNKILLVNF
jgi:hypothetical protein